MNTIRIVLIGNPNCGKTTLFNALTGGQQKVGNWPGVTIEKKSGTFTTSSPSGESIKCEIVDLPGIYSLEQASFGLDEEIARRYLSGDLSNDLAGDQSSGEFDVIINIVDAGNLQRNLVLTQQLLELGHPLVVALNMLDVAAQQGVTIDTDQLAGRLGVPVAPIIASRQQGLDALLAETLAAPELNPAGDTLSDPATLLVREPGKVPVQASEKASRGESAEAGFTSEKLIKRYHKAEQIVGGVVQQASVERTITERIDAWVLNKWLGPPVFLLLMYLMFTVAVNLGAVFIDFFDIFFGAVVVETPRWILESLGAPAWLVVLLADGLGGGIRLVATFIPVIGGLFLCLSLLEASGYMSRAAFVVDRLMGSIGLPGNAFVPLIVGFGCNVPAVMAARSLGRESDRLLTIAMAPFMSCGARLTVYALFAAALFPDNGQNIIFALYLLGIAMAVLTGWLFRKQIFDTEVTPSFQEMPSYHLPVLRNILLTSWFRLKGFVFRAGKTIVLVVVALSFLNSTGIDGSFGNENSDRSVLAVIGKSITPLFAPIGLHRENWPATVGLFTGLFAKEAVVGTLDALYSRETNQNRSGTGPAQGRPDLTAATVSAVVSIFDNLTDLAGNLGDPLGIQLESSGSIEGAAAQQGVTSSTLTNMASMFDTRFAAFCYLVFILLYAPCVAVLGATAKEAGLAWMLLMFCWTTGLAYVTSSSIYQAGTFTSHPGTSFLWLLGCALVSFFAVKLLKIIGRQYTGGELIRVVQVN